MPCMHNAFHAENFASIGARFGAKLFNMFISFARATNSVIAFILNARLCVYVCARAHGVRVVEMLNHLLKSFCCYESSE